MSCNSKSVLLLLRRCVSVRQVTLSAGNVNVIKTRGSVLSGRCGFIQQRTPTRTDCLRSFCQLQSALKSSQNGLCTKAGETSDNEYPPLPAYHTESEPEKKDVYIVQVKGLPWSCTTKDLLQFFSDCRIRDGVAGIYLAMDKLGKPSGRAFIEMEHEEDVSKALEKHRQYLGHRYIEVYEVSNSDAESILKTAAHAPADSWVVRIRGLPFSCTESDIVNFFSGLDIVEDGITIVTDRRGRNSGMAYVQFSSQDAANEALRRDRELIGDRYIEVFPSRRDDIHSTKGMRTDSPQMSYQSGSSRTVPATPTNSGTAYEVSNSDSESIRTTAAQDPADSWVVRIRGIPFSCTESDIVNFFSGLDIVEDGITIVTDRRGRNSGIAYVQFSSQDAANEALWRDRELIGDRYIEVFPSRSDEIHSTKGMRTDSSQMSYQSMSSRTVSATQTNTRTRSSQSSSLPLHYIHMRGLPFEVSGQEVVKFFFPLSVSKILIEYGPDGRTSGNADVYFNCHEDAVAAMSRDRLNIGERYIELFLNSVADSAGR